MSKVLCGILGARGLKVQGLRVSEDWFKVLRLGFHGFGGSEGWLFASPLSPWPPTQFEEGRRAPVNIFAIIGTFATSSLAHE